MAEWIPENGRRGPLSSAYNSLYDEPWSDVSDFECLNAADVDLGEAGLQERLSRSLDFGHDSLPESPPSTLNKDMTWGSTGKTGTPLYVSHSQYQCGTASPHDYELDQTERTEAEAEDTGEDFQIEVDVSLE